MSEHNVDVRVVRDRIRCFDFDDRWTRVKAIYFARIGESPVPEFGLPWGAVDLEGCQREDLFSEIENVRYTEVIATQRIIRKEPSLVVLAR